MEAAPAAAAGEGRGNSEDLAQRVIDAILAANVTQAEVQAAATEGTAAGEDALYWSQQLALLDWSDERGRSVSGIKLDDAVTTFLDEGGEMSTDAHGGCSLHGCSLLQLRRYNELQHQHHPAPAGRVQAIRTWTLAANSHALWCLLRAHL